MVHISVFRINPNTIVSDIAENFLDYYLAGADMLELPEVLSSITVDDIVKRLQANCIVMLFKCGSNAVYVPILIIPVDEY